MPITAATDLLEALRQGRLLEPDQLEEATRRLIVRFPEPRNLARELVKRGWLTPYQVNQIFHGKGRDLLLGSYVVLERLGEGGMGQVLKARNWKLGRIVALKVIRKERLAHGEAVRRFQREIQAVAQLGHPNVVAAFDADHIGDTHFFAMEYVEGTDLSRLVKEKGPLAVASACDYARQAALGLQHAFERGLTHRDIKPANLLLTGAGKLVKILDMGLARVEAVGESDGGSTLTQEGSVMGTPDYIAPEQARDAHSADIRSDLYSLGCTLFFLLTGQVPFPACNLTQKLLKHQLDAPPAVESLRPDVPPSVAAVVRRLMAKKPADRYQTPAEAAAALTTALTTAPPPVPPPLTAPEPEPNFADLAASTVDTPGDTVRRPRQGAYETGRLPFGLILGVLAAVLSAALLVVWLTRPAPGPEPGPSAGQTSPQTRLELSPLDQLDPANIPARERFTGQPKELVAILGEYRAERREEQTPPQGPVYRVSSVAMAAGGRAVATVSAENTLRLWFPADGSLRESGALKADHANAVAFAPDGKRLAAANGVAGAPGDVTLWDVTRRVQKATWPGFADAVLRVAWSANGKLLAAGCRDGSVKVWDHAANREIQTWPPAPHPVTDLTFTHDGRTLVVGRKRYAVKLLDVATGKERATLTGPDALAAAVALAPDDKTLATATSGRLTALWDVAGESIRAFLDGPTGDVQALAYSPDGKMLVSANSEGQVVVWDPTSRKSRRTLQLPGSVEALAFASDSRHLAVANAHNTVYVLRLAPPPSAVNTVPGGTSPKPGPRHP
jgi:serine/threonine protein kinase/WD40 repeat protein